MDIVILGAGALGSALGGMMARAGIPVTLLARNQAHIDAIARNGLKVDIDGESLSFPVSAARPEAFSGPADLIIVLTKTLHTKSALRQVQHLVDRGAYVLTIQNGLGNAERVAEVVPPERILNGCTMIPGLLKAAGHVATHSGAATTFHALQPEGRAFAAKVGALLAPLGFVMDDNAETVIWQKAAFNCAMNAIGALGQARVGDIADEPSTVALAKATAAEVVAIAAAKGIDIGLEAVHAKIDQALARHRQHKSSMLQDIERDRPTEIEALCGTAEREAAALGLPAPLNQALAALVRLRESAARARAAEPKA